MRRSRFSSRVGHVAVATCITVTVGCGAVYGSDPGGVVDAPDAFGEGPPAVPEASVSDAPTAPLDSAPPFDGAVAPVKCASSAPKCDAPLLATANGNPTSMALLGSSLYWADLTSKTIQVIPAAAGLQISTPLVTAGGRPSRLTASGSRLIWFSENAAAPSPDGTQLNACTPTGAGCAVSTRAILGTSAPAVGADGMYTFGTANTVGFMMVAAQIVRIPADLSSSSSQIIAPSEAAIIEPTFTVGDRLVWVAGGMFSCVPTNCTATRIAITSLPGNLVASAVDATSIAWIDSSMPSAINRCAVGAACMPQKIGTAASAVTALMIDGAYVVFATSGAGGTGLYRCPLTGCGSDGPELVARGGAESAAFVAADAAAYYWVDRAPVGNGLSFYRAPR